MVDQIALKTVAEAYFLLGRTPFIKPPFQMRGEFLLWDLASILVSFKKHVNGRR